MWTRRKLHSWQKPLLLENNIEQSIGSMFYHLTLGYKKLGGEQEREREGGGREQEKQNCTMFWIDVVKKDYDNDTTNNNVLQYEWKVISPSQFSQRAGQRNNM